LILGLRTHDADDIDLQVQVAALNDGVDLFILVAFLPRLPEP